MERDNKGRRHSQGEQGGYDRQHEALVREIQNYIRETQRTTDEQRMRAAKPELVRHRPPEEIIRDRIDLAEGGSWAKMDFWKPILEAWDALAYDRYEPGSSAERMAGHHLSKDYVFDKGLVIKLTPGQVQVIDALTTAVGIPHRRGQAEIQIPEKLRDYSTWEKSKEYQDRVAQAKAKRKG